jgi:aryl-alcohol dehydrogenase-like predicted oxidoreductase/ferredoxin-like protein FixX
MELRELGKTGIKVTPIGMGVLTVGRNQLNLSIEEGALVVEHALKSGINFLDTAQYYETYPYIREVLNGTDFRPVIASKSLDSTYEDMKYAVDECLRELNLAYIDIFLLHEVREAPDFTNRSGAWKYLKEAKEKGLVKAIGISTHYVDVAEMAANLDDLDVLFPLVNFKSLGIRDGANQGQKEDMARAIASASENGKGVFAMKVFGGGVLIGEYMEAMDYVNSLTGIDSMMIGFGTKDDVDRAIAYAEGRLPKGFQPDISHKRIQIDKGDCESCGSCIPVCPNKAISFDENGIAEVNHDVCITCGYCAPACPVRAIIMF